MADDQDVPKVIAALRAFADGLDEAFPTHDKDAPLVMGTHADQLGALLHEDAQANEWWRSLTAQERVAVFEVFKNG